MTGLGDWVLHATCRDPAYDPDLWFADAGTEEGRGDLARARHLCATCPVREVCLQNALDQEAGGAEKARHGIRGGLSRTQRHRLDRARIREQQAPEE